MECSKIKLKFTSVFHVCKHPSLSSVFIFLVGANEVECEMSDIAAGSNQS